MQIYELLSKIPFLRRYSFKFLFVAFLGLHIPLLGVIAFTLGSGVQYFQPHYIFLATLLFTLLATGLTLFILNQLLAPLSLSLKALDEYLQEQKLPDLPTHFTDEAGLTMQKIQFVMANFDDLINAKKDLISLLSHDLRTPLGQISGLGQLIELNPKDEAVPGYARQIALSANKQLSLLEEVLKLLKQGDLEIPRAEMKTLRLAPLVAGSLAQLQHLMNEKELSGIIQIPEDLNVFVKEELFTQVLQNIFHNAIKFSFQKGKISVWADQKGKNTYLYVKDEGMGFDAAAAELIFGRFTKHGQTGTHGEKSTGLGLYLSRKIIERHKGQLTAKSPGAGKGACIELVLPAQA